MVETVAALFASTAASTATTAAVTTAGHSLGATVAATAAAGATAATGASLASTLVTTASLLSGGFSILSGLASAQAQTGVTAAQARSLELQAEQSMLNARQEAIRGVQQGNIIRARTLRAMASNTAAAGASGIDLNSGSVNNVQDAVLLQSDRQLSISRADADMAEYGGYLEARNKYDDAAATRKAGGIKVRSTLFETAANTLKRGSLEQFLT